LIVFIEHHTYQNKMIRTTYNIKRNLEQQQDKNDNL
jgi:hypothetical protein